MAGGRCRERGEGKDTDRKIGEPAEFTVTEIRGVVVTSDEMVLPNVVKCCRN